MYVNNCVYICSTINNKTNKMNNTIKLLKQTIETSKEDLKKFSRQLQMENGRIISHNYVISVAGVYTITSKNGMLDYKLNTEFPSYFTKEDAEANIEALKVNDDREITVVNRHKWYNERIENIKNFIEVTEKAILNLK